MTETEVRGQRLDVRRSTSKQTRVAVIAHRVGPYHFSRLRAAAQVVDTTAVELSGADITYAWDLVTGADGFKRVTVFADADSATKPVEEVVRGVRSALDECRPAVVAVSGWAEDFSLAALAWCGSNRIPAIMMSETTAWDERRMAWKEWMKRRLVGLCSAALVGGRPQAEYLEELGMPRERIFLGYDAVDNEHFAQGADEVRGQRSEVRGQPGEVAAHFTGQEDQTAEKQTEDGNQKTENKNPFQLSAFSFQHLPDRYFLASARFIEKKNLPGLIQAYARYRTLCEDHKTTRPQDNGTAEGRRLEVGGQRSEVSGPVVPWSLVLLGDGPLRATLNSQLSTLNLHGHVQMPGFKQYDELPVYYGLASAFVHASTTEQWGLVVNEAMASGLPVLVSNRCGCAPDLVQEGVNGFTFDPYNVEQLARLMLRIAGTTDSGTTGQQDCKTTGLKTRGQEPEVGGQRSEAGLEKMGRASREIISHWGPERFAAGLRGAVEVALRIPPPKATLLDRLLLRLLLLR